MNLFDLITEYCSASSYSAIATQAGLSRAQALIARYPQMQKLSGLQALLNDGFDRKAIETALGQVREFISDEVLAGNAGTHGAETVEKSGPSEMKANLAEGIAILVIVMYLYTFAASYLPRLLRTWFQQDGNRDGDPNPNPSPSPSGAG